MFDPEQVTWVRLNFLHMKHRDVNPCLHPRTMSKIRGANGYKLLQIRRLYPTQSMDLLSQVYSTPPAVPPPQPHLLAQGRLGPTANSSSNYYGLWYGLPSPSTAGTTLPQCAGQTLLEMQSIRFLDSDEMLCPTVSMLCPGCWICPKGSHKTFRRVKALWGKSEAMKDRRWKTASGYILLLLFPFLSPIHSSKLFWFHITSPETSHGWVIYYASLCCCDQLSIVASYDCFLSFLSPLSISPNLYSPFWPCNETSVPKLCLQLCHPGNTV